MTIDTLTKAKSLQSNIKAIIDMKQILYVPYPVLQDHASNKEVSFVELDKETREGLKEVMIEYLNERQNALNNEFKEL